VEVRDGPGIGLSRAELEPLHRQILDAVRMFRQRDGLAPYEFLQLAIGFDLLVKGSAAELRNPPDAAAVPRSGQPAALTVKQAALRMEVSESYVRRLVRHGVLEVRAGRGPTRVYADSVAAHQERRRRKGGDCKAA